MTGDDYRPLELPRFPAGDDVRAPEIRRTIHDEISAWFGHFVLLVVFVAAVVPFIVFCFKLTVFVWFAF